MRGALESAQRSESAGDWQTAIQYYDRARQLDPSMGAFIDASVARVRAQMGLEGTDAFRRARQYDALGRVDDAIIWYERAFGMLPDADSNKKIAEERLGVLRGGQ